MQGASALERVLSDVPQQRVKVFVVWEPILSSDRQAPSNAVLARVADRRVAQFWDEGWLVSRALSGPLVATGRAHVSASNGKGDVIWDTVAVYAPGMRWEEAAPAAAFVGGPVLRVTKGLSEALGSRL